MILKNDIKGYVISKYDRKEHQELYVSETLGGWMLKPFGNDIIVYNTIEEADAALLKYSLACAASTDPNIPSYYMSGAVVKEYSVIVSVQNAKRVLDNEAKRKLAHQLVDAYFDRKDIIVKDEESGVLAWTSIYSNEIWTYLGEFCSNVEKYKIVED